jgi:oligopeptidase B
MCDLARSYDYIASYSPYDNVRDAAYPTTLILGGLTDSRVTYWEPAKMAAAMRDHNTGHNKILLKVIASIAAVFVRVECARRCRRRR